MMFRYSNMMKIGRWAAAAAGIIVALLIAAAPASASSASDTAKQIAMQEAVGEMGLISAGPTLLVIPMKFCGTAGSFPGGVNITTTPQIYIGDCDNGNVHLFQDGTHAMISVLDDAVISVVSWQGCGSALVGGVGLTISMAPTVVYGDCNNANITID